METKHTCENCGKPTERGWHHGKQWGAYKKNCSAECRVSSQVKKQKVFSHTKKGQALYEQLRVGLSKRQKENHNMNNEETRKKVSETLKRMGHKPPIQGGNGKKISKPQEMLLQSLGRGWVGEFVVATGENFLPNHYKIDIAHPAKKIAIEVDGLSHGVLKIRQADHKKTLLLEKFGWKVLRFKNKQILESITSVLADIRAI